MKVANTRTKAWAILMRSRNQKDGRREYLLGTPDHPCKTMLFESRRKARAFASEEFGYLNKRPDLRREPHGWKPPQVVRVTINIVVTA